MSNWALDVYRNNLKNREFGKETSQNLQAKAMLKRPLPNGQGASKHENFEEKPALIKTDSLGCFGIFRNKKVLITGGSSGIGKALAHALLSHGAEVTIVSHQEDKLQSTSAEFRAAGLCVNILQCDLAKPKEISQLVENVNSRHGTPDILINNAGYAVYRTFEQSSIEEIENLMQVNLLAAMRLVKHFLPEFIRRKSGKIVNIASIAGKVAITPNGTYATAKHGLVAWSECLLYELSRFNIDINVICPGRVITPFFDHETFQSRVHRKETRYLVPLPIVVQATLNAIAKNRFITYVPKTLGLMPWLKGVFPRIINPLYRRLMLSRIESIYNPKNDSGI